MNFEIFDENSGLPSTQVYDLYQDDNGYLWIASDRGIARYDGYHFDVFGASDGITANTVFKFYPQSNGDVWCSTLNNQLFYFNISDYKFKPYEHNDTLVKYAFDAVINDLYLDESGSLLISYVLPYSELELDNSGVVVRKKISSELKWHVAVLEKAPNGYFFDYYLDSFDELKSRTEGGKILSSQKVVGSSFKSVHFGSHSVFSDAHMVYIKNGSRLILSIDIGLSPLNVGKYDDTHFWVGYREGGVKIFDFKGNITHSYLPEESVTFLLIDHENGMWISSLSSGIFYCKQPDVRIHFLEKEKYIYNLARDKYDNLWISLYNGHTGVYKNSPFSIRYTSKDRNPIPIDYHKGRESLAIYSNGSLFLNHEMSSSLENAYSTISFSDDKLLFSSIGGWALSGTRSNTFYFSKQRIKDAILAPQGFYLATHRGLFFYDTVTRKEELVEDKSLQYRIEDIEQIAEKYFFATLGSGIIIKSNRSTQSILKKDGLFSNHINKLYSENDSTLWACTNMGLNRLLFGKNGEYSISGVSKNDGLIYNNITDVEVIGDTVWVGTRAGLCSFPKSLLSEDNHRIPIDYHLRFCVFEINDKNVSLKQLSQLSYDQNKLTFHFKAISFRNRSSLVYRYKISELESEWNYTSEQNCTYASVPFGNYHLQVQVSPDRRTWSPEITQSFSISPPFYRTWWFIALMVLSFSGAIYLFFKLRVLVYNRDVTRELIRLLIQKLKWKERTILFREQGKDVRLKSSDVLYVKSSNNYIEIFTKEKTHIVRFQIGEFLSIVPDPLEYIRIHRSYIIRIDKVDSKSVKSVQINDVEIPVGRSYIDQLDKIHF